MYLTAQQIYNKLHKQNITSRRGQTIMTFMDISVTIDDHSATGDLIQSWLGKWMQENDIEYRVKDNTQEFPDFLLDEQSDEQNLLEVKTFDWERSPNFDLANFDAYRRSILVNPYRLDADYLILGYTLIDGVLQIPKIWLRKIWEIAGPSGRYPLKCQVKQNIIHNIRPITWYSNQVTYHPFASRLEFVQALHDTIKAYKPDESGGWLEQVKTNYAEHTGQAL
jgi:hypothetical protein